MELALQAVGTRVHQVYAALKERIESGALKPGARLPGSRALARDVGVSRGTVVAAYEQLEAEGYCRSAPRAGTRVADVFPRAAAPARRAPPEPAPHTIRWPADETERPLDLRFGLPNPHDFPSAVWTRLARRALRRSQREWFSYPAPEGLPRLREAVAAHLRAFRGLDCSAEHVLITRGAQQAFGLIARALLPAGVPVAVEDPGYRGFSQAVRAAGLETAPVPVDGDGLVVDRLAGRTLSAAYVTPAHQFPSGVILSVARRRALLGWARSCGGWIVEDDYDSAYRFGAPPLAPLKREDRWGRVLLVGSFSKTVFPALRLGYVVAPPRELRLLALMKNLDDAGSAHLEQAVLAAFLEEGHYLRHLRRSVRNNARRRRALIDALQQAFGERVRLLGAASGLHLVADLGLTPEQERLVVRAAREAGVGLYAQAAFSQGGDAHRGLVLGFSRLEPEDLGRAVAVLARAVAAVGW